MSEVTARWIPVSSSRVGGANRVYQRVEVYSTPLDPVTTAAASAPASPFASAQFGGNILTVQEGVVVIQKASGKRKKLLATTKGLIPASVANSISIPFQLFRNGSGRAAAS